MDEQKLCTAQLSGLGEDQADSLCTVVTRINANFDKAAAAIAKLSTMSDTMQSRIADTEKKERAIERVLRQQSLPVRQRQALQNKLKEIKDARERQQRSLQDIRQKVADYTQLQDMLEMIRQGTDGLRRKASSIPIQASAEGAPVMGLGVVDAFGGRPSERRNIPYRPIRRRPTMKRDVLGRILPRTVPVARPKGLGMYQQPRYARRSGLTPNVRLAKRQMAEQEQAAARMRRAMAL